MISLCIVGGLVVLTLGRVFFSVLSNNSVTAEQEFALLSDIAANQPVPPESPYVYFVKETSFGASRSVLYIKGDQGKDVFVMLDAGTKPMLKVSPQNAVFSLTQAQFENMEKSHEMSNEVKRYLEKHITR